MAKRAPGGQRNTGTVKRRTRASLIWRFLGRLSAAAVALLVFTLVAIQFARVVDANFAISHELSSTQSDITQLQSRREWQLRQLRRLEDPEGAVPEIHDRLRLVRPNEAIVFVSPMPSPPTSPTP